MADQCTIGHGVYLAAYSGRLILLPSWASHFLLTLPETPLLGRTV